MRMCCCQVVNVKSGVVFFFLDLFEKKKIVKAVISIHLCYLSSLSPRSHDDILYLLLNQKIKQNMNVISIIYQEQIMAVNCSCTFSKCSVIFSDAF